MYLLIDVGNTRIKWILVNDSYDESKIIYGTVADLEAFITSLDVSNTNVLLAAVNQSQSLMSVLASYDFCSMERVTTQSKQLGVQNSYRLPERMGIDRWLAMVAAYQDSVNCVPRCGVIIVDAGSALTVDVVNDSGLHLGGYIVPGIEMAKRSLFSNTEQVFEYKEPIDNLVDDLNKGTLGINTLQCVEYGVIKQLTSLIQSTIDTHPNYQIVFTGGDREYLSSFFQNVIIENNLVLKGLWQVRN